MLAGRLRHFLIGSTVTGMGGAEATWVLRDDELGAPTQTYRGSMPWVEGAADSPPGAAGMLPPTPN